MKSMLTLFLLTISFFLIAGERLIQVNGHSFRIKTMGTGKVCVLFENGMSDSLEVWKSIPDSVAKYARVFLYDRADIGKSGPSWHERTIPNVVDELKSILLQENIQPPYVLAGHSLGGLIDRYYASVYSGEVKGMILFDPSPEAFWKAMSKGELKKYIKGGNEWYESRFEPKYRNEWNAFIPNLAYMDSLNIRASLPVIIISCADWNWEKYQQKIIDGMTDARLEVWKGSHYTHIEHPDSTIRCIRELVMKTLN